MNFGILAAGAAQGLGEGLKDLGKQWREDDIRAENHRMEMEKEKRLEEANIRSEGRQQGYTKEAEQRAIANRAITAQQDIDIANKPENVQAKANAEKTLAQAKIDVELDPNNTAKKLALKQAELDMQAASQIKVHQATDTTDYAGRALDHQIKQATLSAALESSKTPESVKTALKGYDEQIKKDQRALSLVSDDPVKSAAIDKRITQSVEMRNALAYKYMPEDAKKAIDELKTKREGISTEIGSIVNNGLPAEKPKTTDTSSVVVPQPEKSQPVEQTKNNGIFGKQKTKITGDTSPLITGKLKNQYEELSPELKSKVDEILNIENADSNRKLQLIQNVVNRSK